MAGVCQPCCCPGYAALKAAPEQIGRGDIANLTQIPYPGVRVIAPGKALALWRQRLTLDDLRGTGWPAWEKKWKNHCFKKI